MVATKGPFKRFMVITMSTRFVNVHVTDNRGYVPFVLFNVFVTDVFRLS